MWKTFKLPKTTNSWWTGFVWKCHRYNRTTNSKQRIIHFSWSVYIYFDKLHYFFISIRWHIFWRRTSQGSTWLSVSPRDCLRSLPWSTDIYNDCSMSFWTNTDDIHHHAHRLDNLRGIHPGFFRVHESHVRVVPDHEHRVLVHLCPHGRPCRVDWHVSWSLWVAGLWSRIRSIWGHFPRNLRSVYWLVVISGMEGGKLAKQVGEKRKKQQCIFEQYILIRDAKIATFNTPFHHIPQTLCKQSLWDVR